MLARAGVAVVPTWVLDAAAFDEHLRDGLSTRVELRALVKLAGSLDGVERCARVNEELLAAPLSDALSSELADFVQSIPQATDRVLVRPSLVARHVGTVSDVGRFLVPRECAANLSELEAAVRLAWAAALSSLETASYAEHGLRDVGVALLVQHAPHVAPIAWLARAFDPQRREEPRAWSLGLPIDEGGSRAPGPLDFVAIEDGPSAEADARPELPPVRELGEGAFAFAARVAGLLERGLGRDACAALVASPSSVPPFAVLVAEAAARWAPDRSREQDAWIEIVTGSDGAAPTGALVRSLASGAAERLFTAGLHELGAAHDEPRRLVWSTGGRLYLGLDTVAAAVRDVPALTWEDVYRAVGTASHDFIGERRGAAEATKRPLRAALGLGRLASRQARSEREFQLLERELAAEASALAELDLSLLPTDAIATTFLRAEDLLSRGVELWGRLAASQLAHLVTVRLLLRRASDDADLVTASLVTSGRTHAHGVALVGALARVVDVMRSDARAHAALRDGVGQLTDLPDGPGRGAVRQFLSTFGAISPAPFDLEVPTWAEAPSDVFDVLRAWLTRDGSARVAVEVAEERVSARADAELARFEPDLGWTERSALRSVIAHAREVSRARAAIDPLLHRIGAQLRRVSLDADRRLRRIDPATRVGAVFTLPLDRIVAAFRTGRPEVRHLVGLADFESELERLAPAPPRSFRGAPPRMPAPVPRADTLSGIGVSAGVADGCVRRGLEVEGCGVLVASTLCLARVPHGFLAGAVVSETAGILSSAADALRALGVPVVASVEGATACLREGDRLRVDGTRGVVHRLATRGGE